MTTTMTQGRSEARGTMRRRAVLISMAMAACVVAQEAPAEDLPAAIAAKDRPVLLQVHAVGAQIYECKPDTGSKKVWRFREPIATLFVDGKTIGRHYVGPSWELTDGSAIVGKQAASSPGALAKDSPWLRLDVVEHHGQGRLAEATLVQRINTKGGSFQGDCDLAGRFYAEPYEADYIFLK